MPLMHRSFFAALLSAPTALVVPATVTAAPAVASASAAPSANTPAAAATPVPESPGTPATPSAAQLPTKQPVRSPAAAAKPSATAEKTPTAAASTPAVPASAAGSVNAAPSTSLGASSKPAAAAVKDPMLVPPAPPTQMLASWQQAVNLVRARSTSLRTATAQSLLAAAETQKALVAFYPTLNAVGSVQRAMISGTLRDASTGNLRNDLPDPATTWNATVSLRQPLLDLGAWHDHRTAELSERAAHERQSDAQRVALGAVASTIVTVVTAERLAEVSRIALSSSLSTLELTQRRAELGASSTVDVLRAQQEVALNRAQVVSATEAVAKSREGLGMALGYAEAWGVSPNVHLDGLAQDAAGICKTVTGVATRADVQAARTQAEISARAIDRSNLTLAPRVDLNSDFTYTTRPVTDNGRPEQWTIGALLTVPLYDGGMRAAARQVASAHAEVAAEELSHTDRQASLEILQADRAVRVASETFQVSVTSRDLAKETARLAELSFVNGKGTNFELVDAQRRAQQAELDLAVKEFEVVKARLTALLARANCTF